jgi:hypothetical protein
MLGRRRYHGRHRKPRARTNGCGSRVTTHHLFARDTASTNALGTRGTTRSEPSSLRILLLPPPQTILGFVNPYIQRRSRRDGLGVEENHECMKICHDHSPTITSGPPVWIDLTPLSVGGYIMIDGDNSWLVTVSHDVVEP